MIPKINNRGHSFKGVTAYLMHDKEAKTNERVVWTETGNMWTDDIHKAAKIMAWTDLHAEELKRDAGISSAGRKTETGAVYHYSLSWAQDETPEQEHQKDMANATLERLGLSEHQYYFVAHNDTKHDHVHIVVNLTHHETGKRAELPLDKNKVQAWALEYEQERKIYCEARVENARKRGQREYTKYQDEKQHYNTQVTRAYHASDNGKTFVNALEMEGLRLTNGDRNKLVIVDKQGKIQAFTRNLDIEQRAKEKTKAIAHKLADIDRETLPNANTVSNKIKEDIKQQNTPDNRDAAEAKRQQKLKGEAEKAAVKKVQLEEARAKIKAEEQKALQQKSERISRSREKHDIDGAEQRLKEAQEQYEPLHGFVTRILKRQQFEEAYDNLQNRKMQLAEQMRRFEMEIKPDTEQERVQEKDKKKSLESAENLELKNEFDEHSNIEEEQAHIAAEFERMAKEKAGELEEMPEFDNEEQEQIWLELQERNQNRDNEHDNGLER